jgi:hypothetical protein
MTVPVFYLQQGLPIAARGSFFAANLVRSITSHATGSWYFEMTPNVAADITKIGVGIDNNVESLTSGAGQAGDGTVNYNGTAGAYSATPFSVGDVLGVNVNLTSGTIQFRRNGSSFFTFSISAIIGPSMFALAQLKNPFDQVTANFTGVNPAFSFSAPSTAWG